jgi:virginiamycin B lyase
MTKRVFGILLVLVALMAGAAASASGAVYWGNLDTGTVGRGSLDGSSVDRSFISGVKAAQYVAVDATHVYWADVEGGIGRANLDGSAVDQNFIPNVHPVGLAVDSAHVYWSNVGTGTIGRANLDGSGANPNLVTGLLFPTGLALHSGRLYWADQGTGKVGRAELDGSNPEVDFMSGLTEPTGVAIDADHLYIGSESHGIVRANLDGTGVEPFIAAIRPIQGVAVDGDHLYWASLGDNAISRIKLDGSEFEPQFISGVSLPVGVAVDGASVPPPAPPSPPTTPPSSTLPTSSAAIPPKLSGLSLSRRAFAVGRRGTRFSFRLDQAASVRVRIQRKLSGGRLRKRGALKRAGRAGANRIRFRGRVSGRALRPGRYRAVFTAANAAGRSAPRAVAFRIVAR